MLAWMGLAMMVSIRLWLAGTVCAKGRGALVNTYNTVLCLARRLVHTFPQSIIRIKNVLKDFTAFLIVKGFGVGAW